MLKKIYNFFFPILFFICYILSFIFDSQRVFVMILSIIALLSLLAIIIIHLLNLIDKKISYPVIIVAIIMLIFENGKYTLEVHPTPINTHTSIVIILALICSIYKTCVNCLAVERSENREEVRAYINNVGRKKPIHISDIKNFFLFFIFNMLTFSILFIGSIEYINYSFDLSQEKQGELIIEKQIDDGHTNSGYDHVFITYKVKANDFKIETIDISDEYKLASGDKVTIFYREGVFTPLYGSEYNSYMWLPAPLIGD